MNDPVNSTYYANEIYARKTHVNLVIHRRTRPQGEARNGLCLDILIHSTTDGEVGDKRLRLSEKLLPIWLGMEVFRWFVLMEISRVLELFDIPYIDISYNIVEEYYHFMSSCSCH